MKQQNNDMQIEHIYCKGFTPGFDPQRQYSDAEKTLLIKAALSDKQPAFGWFVREQLEKYIAIGKTNLSSEALQGILNTYHCA